MQNPALQHRLASRPLLNSECAPARIVSQKMHLMLDFQRLAHKTCNESYSSHLPVITPDPSTFLMTSLRVRWLVVGVDRSIVLVCVGGRTNLIGLLCVFLRQCTPQLRDFVVI